jgi:transcriptional regulator with XRE-family HTH domain
VTDESPGPIVLRLLVGSRLRHLREARGIALHDAARAIRATDSKISQIERGRIRVRETDAEDLLTLYGVTDRAEREELLTLAAQSGQRGWWHRYGDLVPDWQRTYIGLEQAARSIRTYQPQFVPGLLQTEGYAAALIELAGRPPGEIERRGELLRDRQRRFRDGSLYLWAILDEAVLRRRVGDATVMREQLDYLRRASARENLTLQVTPFDSGGVAAPGGFSIIRFQSTEVPDMVYTEQLTSASYIDKQAEVAAYLVAMERLTVMSARPRESAKIIESVLGEGDPRRAATPM